MQLLKKLILSQKEATKWEKNGGNIKEYGVQLFHVIDSVSDMEYIAQCIQIFDQHNKQFINDPDTKIMHLELQKDTPFRFTVYLN